MKKLILVLYVSLFNITAIFAGPGGKIAKEVLGSPLGKIVGVILLLIFFPIVIRSFIKRRSALNETRTKLNKLTKLAPEVFDEINLKNRMTDVFMRVHIAWSNRDLDDCEEYMTHWYRQNQQTVFLDKWDRMGMMNVCTIKSVNSIKPIHLRLTNTESFEGTRIMFLVDATMEDYLVKVDDSSVVEGERGFRQVDTVWTLKLVDRVWKVDNIEQSEMLSDYLKLDTQVTDELLDSLVASKSK